MANYDVESFCDDLKTFVQSNLNTKITAINAEKADSITLSSVASDAYMFQTTSDEVANFNPFVFYGVANFIEDNNIPGNSDVAFNAQVLIILTDEGNDLNIVKRLLRYHRCLKEIFDEGFQRVSKLGNIKISSIGPDFVPLIGRAGVDRFVGLNLEVHLP